LSERYQKLNKVVTQKAPLEDRSFAVER